LKIFVVILNDFLKNAYFEFNVCIIKMGRVYNVSLSRGMGFQIPNGEKGGPRSLITSPDPCISRIASPIVG